MGRAWAVAAVMAALAAPAGAEPRSGAPAADAPPAIHPDWAALPNGNDIGRLYPTQAVRRGVSGDTKIQCAVEPDGSLVDCEVLLEKPAGMGFGAAAIQASRRFRMTPYPAAQIHGRRPRVIIPIHWALASTPARASAPTSRTLAALPAPVKPLPGFWRLFPVLFIGMWLVVASLLGLMSGWYGLMERYPDRRETASARIGLLSGVMGRGIGVSLGGILTLAACPSGLRVSIWRIFGPFSRPFLVPWREISAQPKTIFFSPMVRLSFGNPEVGVLSLDARAWQRLAGAARQSVGSRAPPAYAVSEARLIGAALLQWLVTTAFAAAFFYFAPRLLSPKAEAPPLAVCLGFPAAVFGVNQVIRYLGRRRRG